MHVSVGVDRNAAKVVYNVGRIHIHRTMSSHIVELLYSIAVHHSHDEIQRTCSTTALKEHAFSESIKQHQQQQKCLHN